LQKVYEARATSFTAWCRMVQYVTQYPDREDAIARAVNSLQFDALALTDCPGMLWSLMRRCLHWGPILYSCCFIRECGMPIVPINVLVELLKVQVCGMPFKLFPWLFVWLTEMAKGCPCNWRAEAVV